MFYLKPLNKAIQNTLLITILGISSITATQTFANEAMAEQQFNIAAGALDQVLTRFAAQAGIALAFDHATVSRLNSNGLQGKFSVQDGLNKILASQPYQAQKTATGYILIAKAQPQVRDMGQLNPIDVTASGTAKVNKSVTQLPAITVIAESNGYTAKNIGLGKIKQSVKETPQSISILTSKRLEDSNYATLDQALEQSTGMTVQTSGNVSTYYYSRGFEVALQKDGINSGYLSGERALENLAMYEQVEIQRGASGLLTGAGQPGGVVNLIRKRPLHEDQINLTLKAGSWNTYKGTFDISNTFLEDQRLRSRLILDYENRDYFVDIAHNENLALYGIVEYDLLPNTTLSLGANYNKREAVPEITGVPRNADGSDSKFDKTKYLGAAWNKWDIDSSSIFGGITHQFSDDWSLKINGKYENRLLNYKRVFYNGTRLNLNTHFFDQMLGYYSGDMEIDDYGMDATLNGKFNAFGQEHDIMLGYTSQRLLEPRPWNTLTLDIPAVSLEDFDPYSIANPNTPNVPVTGRQETTQKAFLAMTRLNPIDSFHIILGARLSDWKYKTKNFVTGAIQGVYQDNNVLTPYGGIVFDITQNLSTYTSYADTFRVQSNYYTVSGERLDPAVGANYEIGLKYELWEGQLISSLALFRIDEDNRAIADPDNPSPCIGSPTNGACYINAGKVRSEGFEAELSGEIVPDLQLTAGYTYNKTEYLNDTSTNQGRSYSTFTPKQILRVWGSYNLPFYDKRLTLGGGVNLQSKSRNIANNMRV